MGLVIKVCRFAGLGTLSYMFPRFLVGLGVPLDVWAVKAGRMVGSMIDKEFALTIIAMISATFFVFAELWLRPVGRIINRFNQKISHRASQKGSSEPNNQPSLHVFLNESDFEITDYECICAIMIQSNQDTGPLRCDACIEQTTATVENNTPIPFGLRTERQIIRRRSGIFDLLPRQTVRVPIIFRCKTRRNEWFIFGENGKRHLMSYGNTKMLLSISCDQANSKWLLEVHTSRNFNIDPTLTDVTGNEPTLIGSQEQLEVTREDLFNQHVKIDDLEDEIELNAANTDGRLNELREELIERKRQYGPWYANQDDE